MKVHSQGRTPSLAAWLAVVGAPMRPDQVPEHVHLPPAEPEEPPEVLGAISGLHARLSPWEVLPEELEISPQVLGYGATSIVYLGRLRGEQVAVKECNLEGQEESVIAFIRELEVWPEVVHPQILRCFAFGSVGMVLRVCSEFCRGGTLFDLLHNCWHTPLSWMQRRKILVDIASAVEYLHNLREPVMHRDLKSLNVFLKSPVTDDQTLPEIRLADFGFARVRHAQNPDSCRNTFSGELTIGAGTPHWMAPEVSMPGARYHEAVDVFSFAIITYEVICRHMSFEDLDAESAREQIMAGARPSLQAVPPDTPPALIALMVSCWQQDPLARPFFREIHRVLREEVSWPQPPGAAHG